MAAIEFLLFWVPVAFAILVAASYVGTTLALRAYFEDERFQPSDVVRVGGDPPDR